MNTIFTGVAAAIHGRGRDLKLTTTLIQGKDKESLQIGGPNNFDFSPDSKPRVKNAFDGFLGTLNGVKQFYADRTRPKEIPIAFGIQGNGIDIAPTDFFKKVGGFFGVKKHLSKVNDILESLIANSRLANFFKLHVREFALVENPITNETAFANNMTRLDEELLELKVAYETTGSEESKQRLIEIAKERGRDYAETLVSSGALPLDINYEKSSPRFVLYTGKRNPVAPSYVFISWHEFLREAFTKALNESLQVKHPTVVKSRIDSKDPVYSNVAWTYVVEEINKAEQEN